MTATVATVETTPEGSRELLVRLVMVLAPAMVLGTVTGAGLDLLPTGLRGLVAPALLGGADRDVDRAYVGGAPAALGHGEAFVDRAAPATTAASRGRGPGVLTVLAEQVSAREMALVERGGSA